MGFLLPPNGSLSPYSSLFTPPPPLPTNALGNPYSPGALSLLSLMATPPVLNWQHVRGRFKAFINNLAITTSYAGEDERMRNEVMAAFAGQPRMKKDP
jgi:hypothetical protein